MNLNLNQITIQVKDVAKAIEFYKKLGLNLIVESLPTYARLECKVGNTTFSLHQNLEKRDGNTTWIYFESDELDSDVQKLIENGIQIIEMPNDKPWLWREARIEDLDQNTIILYHAGKMRLNPPWRIN